MNHELFYYDKGLKFDKELFEGLFYQVVTEDERLKRTLNHVTKIFFLTDWTELGVLEEALKEEGQSQEEIDGFMCHYSSDFWRGLCFYKEGIIILNFMEIMNSSDYYCSKSQYRVSEEFRKFIVKDSRFEKIEQYTHDRRLVRQLIFWKTLFHEIRHIEQHYYPDCLSIEDDEKDADDYAIEMFKRKVEPLKREILEIDFVNAL